MSSFIISKKLGDAFKKVNNSGRKDRVKQKDNRMLEKLLKCLRIQSSIVKEDKDLRPRPTKAMDTLVVISRQACQNQ
jgi:hypothetical protein